MIATLAAWWSQLVLTVWYTLSVASVFAMLSLCYSMLSFVVQRFTNVLIEILCNVTKKLTLIDHYCIPHVLYALERSHSNAPCQANSMLVFVSCKKVILKKRKSHQWFVSRTYRTQSN